MVWAIAIMLVDLVVVSVKISLKSLVFRFVNSYDSPSCS